MNYETERNNAWDYVVENGIATEEELRLVTNINGFTTDTINDVIYARTGYRSVEQLEAMSVE